MNAVAPLRLSAICAVAALVLGLANAATAPVIAAGREAELRACLSSLAPGGSLGAAEKVGNNPLVRIWYPVRDARGRPAGFVMRLNAGGYAGEMSILAGFAPTGEIAGVRLLDNSIGRKAEKADYMKKFLGTGAGKLVPTRKAQLSAAEADSISGATISFAGIGRALEAGSSLAKSLGGRK